MCGKSISFFFIMALTSFSLVQADEPDPTDPSRRIYPIVLSENSDSYPLTPDQIKQWQTSGYLVVDGFFPSELIEDTRSEALHLLGSVPGKEDFGGFGFPFNSQPLIEVTLNKRMLAAAKTLLYDNPNSPGPLDEREERKEIRLQQADLWGKTGIPKPYAPLSNADQRMHMDFPNHTLTHPSEWNDPDILAAILYLDDAEECGGPTAVVARESENDPFYQEPYIQMPGVGKMGKWINNRVDAEIQIATRDPVAAKLRSELYAKEKYVWYRKGTVLFYRHDIWHRGTPLTLGKTRMVLNLGYKKAGRDWVTNWNEGPAKGLYTPLAGIIPLLDEAQKNALGMPHAGHPWWGRGKNRENTKTRHEGQLSQFFLPSKSKL